MDLAPERWLGKTSLLNLADDKLRLRTGSLVQFARTERERVLAIYEFVKALPFCAPGSQGVLTARQVLDARTGDCFGKSTLFVAMLRLVHIPARMRFIKLKGELLRGYAAGLPSVTHAVVEIWVDGVWHQTDTHVYDIHYLAIAREKLTAANWLMGYAIHRNAHSVWDMRGNAFAAFSPDQEDSRPLADLGVFDDPRRFMRAMAQRQRSLASWFHAVRWRIGVEQSKRGVRRLRAESFKASLRSLPTPVRISPD